MENKFISHKRIFCAKYAAKIVEGGGNLTKFWQKQFGGRGHRVVLTACSTVSIAYVVENIQLLLFSVGTGPTS